MPRTPSRAASRRTERAAEAESGAREVVAQSADTMESAASKLISAYADGTQVLLEAAFTIENAIVEAELALFGTAADTARTAGKQWVDALRIGQEATIDLVRGLTQAVERRD